MPEMPCAAEVRKVRDVRSESELVGKLLDPPDRRSTGGADEVAADVLKDHELFGGVFAAIEDHEPVVRMRAADAVEKIRVFGLSYPIRGCHDRKTIRAYLKGERVPGERRPGRPEAMNDFLAYCRQRLADDPHLWSTTLFDEVTALGFAGSYQAFTAAIRRHELRPRCAACAANRNKDRSVIEHPPGEETWRDVHPVIELANAGAVAARQQPLGSIASGDVIDLRTQRRSSPTCRCPTESGGKVVESDLPAARRVLRRSAADVPAKKSAQSVGGERVATPPRAGAGDRGIQRRSIAVPSAPARSPTGLVNDLRAAAAAETAGCTWWSAARISSRSPLLWSPQR